MQLANNTILITGGSSGIGLALGRALLSLKNKVILLGRNKEKLDLLKQEGFYVIQCNLENPSEVEATSVIIHNQFPELNILFNNAGVQFNYTFTDLISPAEKISSEININLTGQIILTQLLLPLLNNKKNSFIINTTSGLGAFPKNNALIYSASKAAMRNFTLGLRYSLRKNSIKVLEFIPPVTDTAMTAGRDSYKMSTNELIKQVLPQLQKEKQIITIPKMRLFLWISFLFPSLAAKILAKP